MSFDDFVLKLKLCLEAAFGQGSVTVLPVGGFGNYGRCFTIGSDKVVLNPSGAGIVVDSALTTVYVAKFARVMQTIPQGHKYLSDCARRS
jgi:hypothetical protein